MAIVKICGLTREADIACALDAGADRIGLVVVPSSPRFVTFERASRLIESLGEADADLWIVTRWRAEGAAGQDELAEFIAGTPNLGAVQLHGRETPADVADFVQRFPLVPVVKALSVARKADLKSIADYPEADEFLFDARPPRGADREGGHGRSFDWSILTGFSAGDGREWTLSGGLTPETVGEAIRVSGVGAVDVSSGVEASPGVKDPAKVRAFIAAAKAAR